VTLKGHIQISYYFLSVSFQSSASLAVKTVKKHGANPLVSLANSFFLFYVSNQPWNVLC